MTPLTPKSVKMAPAMYAQIRRFAIAVGYSDNHLIIELLAGTMEQVENPKLPTPKIIHLIRAGLSHPSAPPSPENSAMKRRSVRR
jgi:hypothetical protein